MTLALGFAARAAADAPDSSHSVYVMADTRLTFGRESLDTYIKALTLGQRSAIVAAGHSTLFNLVVEAARPFITANAAERRRCGLPPTCLLMEAGIVWAHLQLVIDDYRKAFPKTASVAMVAAGFFSDGTPGLIRMEQDGDMRQIFVYRPRPGERSFVVVGTPEYVPVLQEAVRVSRPPAGKGYHDVASVLWDIIQHQGEPTHTVGGGLALAFANGNSDYFMWPLVEVAGHVFGRGLRYPPNPLWPVPLKLDYNPSLFAKLERDLAEKSSPSGDSPSAAGVMAVGSLITGDRRLLVAQTDDRWLLEELDRKSAAS